jgi:hypothetical protein
MGSLDLVHPVIISIRSPWNSHLLCHLVTGLLVLTAAQSEGRRRSWSCCAICDIYAEIKQAKE